MANDFSKEEKVAFDEMLESMDDAEVMAKATKIYSSDQTMMARTGDTIWRPQPYIATSDDGIDQTGNFKDKVQLSVPATISYEKASTWNMNAKELRDALQEGRLGKAAQKKLASDINVAAINSAVMYGSLVIPVTTAATGYDDVALADTLMNEIGVQDYDRIMGLSSRDYNNMAGNLAERQTFSGDVKSAYERAKIGMVAGFETFKLPYSQRLTAAAGGAITIATNAAGTFHTPVAVTTSPTTSERLNHDNRYDNVTVSSTTSVAAGDAFTIAGVDAVHHITKQDTGNLKTFRVVEVVDGTTLKITPPLIDPDSGAGAESEKQYQNCTVTTASATAAITWLNTVTAAANPFYMKDALEILPGKYEVPANVGMSVMSGKTDSGITLVMTKQGDINDLGVKYRVDTLFGVVNLQPEMSGIILFSQT